MSQIHYTVDGEVAVLTIDNPPVNALNMAIRGGLLEAVQRAMADAAIQAIVVIGAGKTFVAGADIKEFGKPMNGPSLLDTLAALEASTKPVIAALHGTAGSQPRHHSGRRRHAAPATPDRPGQGARHHHYRQTYRRSGGTRTGHHRRAG